MNRTFLIIFSALFAFIGVFKTDINESDTTRFQKGENSQTYIPKDLNETNKRRVTMYKIEGRGERAEITNTVEGIFYYEYNYLEDCQEGYVVELRDGVETDKNHLVSVNRRSTGVASGFKYKTNYNYFFN